MRRQHERYQTCQSHRKKGEGAKKCHQAPRYVILEPPRVAKPTPTPVWLDDEKPDSAAVLLRPPALYCKRCAYELCGLSVGGEEPIPPPTPIKKGIRAKAS